MDVKGRRDLTSRNNNFLMDDFTSFTGDPFYEKQITVMRDIFTSHDEDRSGAISVDEFIVMVNSMGMTFNRRDLIKVFNKCDANGSGTITFNEFVQYFLKSPKKDKNSIPPERVKQVFKTVDRDNDGVLTREECLEAMKILGKRIEDSSIDQIMKLMDKDNDGEVDLAEFCRFMEL